MHSRSGNWCYNTNVNRNKLILKNIIFQKLKYRDYYNNHEEYMNLIDYKKLYEIIKYF